MADTDETPGDEELEQPPIVFGGDDADESESDAAPIVFPGEDPDESETDS